LFISPYYYCYLDRGYYLSITLSIKYSNLKIRAVPKPIIISGFGTAHSFI
jgi:hypothetical protein